MSDLISREDALMALTGVNLPTDRDKLIALFDERIKALSTVEPQGFEDYLKQYLGENDQMIIGKDVYEELKYEAGEKYNELMLQYKHLRKYASDLETKLSIEQTEWISVKDRLPEKNDCYLVTFNFESNGNPDNGIGVVEFYGGNFYSNGFGVNEDVAAWYINPVPPSPYRRNRE